MRNRRKSEKYPYRSLLRYTDLQDLRNDNRAWIDLILSKTALIFASFIILAALFHLTLDFQQADRQRQLNAMAQDFGSAVDSVGQSHYGTPDANRSYSFDTFSRKGEFTGKPYASVSGEYVQVWYDEDGEPIHSVEPLAYRTLPYNESGMRNELLDHFSATGESTQPITSPFTYSDVTDFLETLATKEKNLNTSSKVHIVKSLIYIVNNSEVRELEYVLVHQ